MPGLRCRVQTASTGSGLLGCLLGSVLDFITMKKICRTCGESKPPADYYRAKENRDGLNRACKTCEKKRAVQWHKDNREKSREATRRFKQNNPDKIAAYNKSPGKRRSQHKYDLRTRYGLEITEYEAMVAEQSGACAACGDVPDRMLVVDHCHKSGRVRGLLCRPCNTALGFMGDDPVLLRRLAEFATQHREGG